MPKPNSKKELIRQSQDNFEKILNILQTLPAESLDKEFPKGSLNRNIKDVLAHLHHWHLLMLEWYMLGMQGRKPEMPAKGYTWKTLPALNRQIRDIYQNNSLTEVKELLYSSHQKILKIIASHSNEELFEKKKYHWTGSTSLGAYLISNTSSHYQWAIKLIVKGLKS